MTRPRNKVSKGSREAFLRRNDEGWAKRHPGSTGWRTAPPLPGAAVHSDVYVARVREPHYGGYGVFATKAKAEAGFIGDTLAFYERGEDMRAFTEASRYTEYYTFHVLVPLPASGRTHRYGR